MGSTQSTDVKKPAGLGRVFLALAETEGFEPSMRLYTPYSLSRGAPSATRSRFQSRYYASFQGLFRWLQQHRWADPKSSCTPGADSWSHFFADCRPGFDVDMEAIRARMACVLSLLGRGQGRTRAFYWTHRAHRAGNLRDWPACRMRRFTPVFVGVVPRRGQKDT